MSFNSSRTKVFSTNETNTIETSTDNLILSDSDYREVVKQGYLLNNISLSSVPDIIQDAIDQAKIDAKDITLADDLLISLRYEVDNLNSGVYTKTYVDQQITYLSEAIVQRVDSETLASVVDSKIAIATEDLVATSTVDILSGRIGDSESSIASLAETVNTNDLARANQTNEAVAELESSLAAYSDVLELTVDENGNATSQKIEDLSVQNYSAKVSISELNEITLDDAGEYTATVAKLITDSDGKTVGFQFADSNDLTSFNIYTDAFTVSNSTSTHTPFSIVNNEIILDAKTTFSNLEGGENIVTTDTVQTAINDNVTIIDGGKIATSEAFVNNLNAQGGIIADNVTANDFYGKNFYGGYFEGALIVGAVLKASYLDLDGELEVLTNYHIPVATYNANPSLYTDAVYTEASNEYRIPSLSTIKEASASVAISSSGNIFNSLIKSYKNGNSGHNNKCVKINPTVTVSNTMEILEAKLTFSTQHRTTLSGKSDTFYIYIGGLYIGSIYLNISITDSQMGVFSPPHYSATPSRTSFNGNGMSFTAGAGISYSQTGNTTWNATFTLYVYASATSFVSNFDTSDGFIKIKNNGGKNVSGYAVSLVSASAVAKTNTNLSVNNMV